VDTRDDRLRNVACRSLAGHRSLRCRRTWPGGSPCAAGSGPADLAEVRGPASGVFLMTSHSGYEGFPRVLVEAMATGAARRGDRRQRQRAASSTGRLRGSSVVRSPGELAHSIRAARHLDRAQGRRRGRRAERTRGWCARSSSTGVLSNEGLGDGCRRVSSVARWPPAARRRSRRRRRGLCERLLRPARETEPTSPPRIAGSSSSRPTSTPWTSARSSPNRGVFHLAGQPGVRSSWGSEFDRYVTDNVRGHPAAPRAALNADRLRRFVSRRPRRCTGTQSRYPTEETDRPQP
jgi:hypothetical protein